VCGTGLALTLRTVEGKGGRMKTRVAHRHHRSGNKRTVIAVASCVLGFGLMAFGLSAGPGSREFTTDGQQPTKANGRNRELPTWNMALGNIVMVPRDLGFSVQVAKGAAIDEGKLASQIEGKLQGLRELYRRESESDPSLMGAMMLQLAVKAGGEVKEVNETASRLASDEFKKAVVAEISKWNFGELFPDAATIHCPLLFVREGMDITTLVNWEKSLGPIDSMSALAQTDSPPEPKKVPARRDKTVRELAKKTPRTAEAFEASRTAVYQLRYGTVVREGPNFSSPAVAKFSSGMKVRVVGKSGDWVEVRDSDKGPRGYIRKEFLMPVTMVNN
jgi:hypothetical protein